MKKAFTVIHGLIPGGRNAMLCMILFLFPLFSFAQNPSDDWSTAVADIEFIEGKIVYSYNAAALPSFRESLLPMSYPADIMRLQAVRSQSMMEPKGFYQLRADVNEYVDNWSVQGSDIAEKRQFLEFCCLLLIWNSNTHPALSENALKELILLENDKAMSDNAQLVLLLYESYEITGL